MYTAVVFDGYDYAYNVKFNRNSLVNLRDITRLLTDET
jgi:hypothetical protein